MTTIIAEFCQNHNGDRAILKDMIAAAAEAGADYAKIQSIRADELTRRERFEEGLEEDGVTKAIRRPYAPEYARLKPLDLDEEAHGWFIAECESAGITPMTTVFTRAAIPVVAAMPWKAVKVASYDCASYPLLKELRQHFDHLFVSTGATYDHEIEQAARVLAGHSYTFLHCVTIYPTPLEEAHLARMAYLRALAPSVGFSDHTLVARDGIKASVAAIAEGADVVERHFSVLPVDQTRDGPVSITPEQLADLVRFGRMPREDVQAYVQEAIPEMGRMMGQVHRALSPGEQLNRAYYRGRFASRVGDAFVYNWEDKPVLWASDDSRTLSV